MLTTYDWIYGSAVLTALFLSFIAGFLAVGLFRKASQRKYLSSWVPLIIALVLFAVEETVGALKVFGIYSTAWLTHVIPGFILIFLIASLLRQTNIMRGCE